MTTLFEKIHRKFFPNDYVSANVVSYAFLVAAEEAANGSYNVTEKVLARCVKTYDLNLNARIMLVDEMIRYLNENTGYLSSLTKEDAEAAVIACCLLSAIAESEDE